MEKELLAVIRREGPQEVRKWPRKEVFCNSDKPPVSKKRRKAAFPQGPWKGDTGGGVTAVGEDASPPRGIMPLFVAPPRKTVNSAKT